MDDYSYYESSNVRAYLKTRRGVYFQELTNKSREMLRNYLKNNDIRIKETDNSRNGHSRKTMHTSYGDMDVAIPKDHNGNYEP